MNQVKPYISKEYMNPLEVVIAESVAKNKSEGSREAGVVDQKKFKEKSGFHIDRLGFLGEMALAKCMNLMPDFSVGPQANGADLVTHDGIRIDVKTTERPDGNLIVKPKENPDVDYYFLVRWDERFLCATIVGWIKKEKLRQERYERVIRGQLCYFCPAKDLRKEMKK